jgi:hypothetical protein
MFKSLLNLTVDVVKISTAPIEVAVDLTREVTKPMADTADDIVKSFKDKETKK